MWTQLIYIALLTLAVHLALGRVRRRRLLLVVGGRVHVVGRAILRRRRVLGGLVANRGELNWSARWVRCRSLSLCSLRIGASVLSSRLGSRLGLSLSLSLSLLGSLALGLFLLLASLPLLANLLKLCRTRCVSENMAKGEREIVMVATSQTGKEHARRVAYTSLGWDEKGLG